MLVNTGNQVFSGTVLGSSPVLLYDDEFRFEVDLNTGGLESGEVHLTDRIAGPKIRCDLVAVGAGAKTPEGDSIVDYSGPALSRSEGWPDHRSPERSAPEGDRPADRWAGDLPWLRE